jgi:ring-1,2-phenylacetyl-CoA epoxidase subunit PaaC
MAAARLEPMPAPPPGALTGRIGRHTAEFAALIDELQSVARAHPGATW